MLWLKDIIIVPPKLKRAKKSELVLQEQLYFHSIVYDLGFTGQLMCFIVIWNNACLVNVLCL